MGGEVGVLSEAGTPPPASGTGPTTTAPAPSPASIAGRLLLYVGLSALLAAALVGRTVFRGEPPGGNALLAAGWKSLRLRGS